MAVTIDVTYTPTHYSQLEITKRFGYNISLLKNECFHMIYGADGIAMQSTETVTLKVAYSSRLSSFTTTAFTLPAITT